MICTLNAVRFAEILHFDDDSMMFGRDDGLMYIWPPVSFGSILLPLHFLSGVTYVSYKTRFFQN